MRSLPVGIAQQSVVRVGGHHGHIVATFKTTRTESLKRRFDSGKVVVGGQVGGRYSRNSQTAIGEVSLRTCVENVENQLYWCLGICCHQQFTLTVACKIGLYLLGFLRV